MRLFDYPLTPSGLRELLPGIAMPTLHLIPEKEGQWRLMVFLSMGGNRFRDFNHRLAVGEVEGLLRKWEEEPQRVLKEVFGWEPLTAAALNPKRPVGAVVAATEKSAEELGL